MKTLGITHGVCPTCRRLVPAKVVVDGPDVYFERFCRAHGVSRSLVWRDVDDYLRSLRYVKPAWVPQQFAGDASAACPTGCGFCSRHEQHLCLPIVEITTRCDLACPACLVSAGRPWAMTRAEFARMLDRLIAAERQIDILNLSGGEPLVHPQVLELIDEALSRPEIVRVSISTNGLALVREPRLLEQLQERNVVVSLQFDGFDPRAYEQLRGRPLLTEKRAILDRLRTCGTTTSLTMTVAGGVNDDQFPAVLDYFFAQPHIVSLMIQPLAFAGRGQQLSDHVARLTIPDIVQRLAAAGHPQVRADDFLPLPCSHPLCFRLAFFLMLDSGGAVPLYQLGTQDSGCGCAGACNGMVSLARLVEPAQWLDALANRTVFGLDSDEQQRLKDMIYAIWSGPAAALPDADAVMQTLRSVLDEMARQRFDPRLAFRITERRVKSIFIHAFQDAETFDLARVRRCCNAYPQPDGTLIPACVHNVLGRTGRGT